MRPRSFCLMFASAFLVIPVSSAQSSAHRHSLSNHSNGQPIGNCSDLRIEFDDRAALVRSEEHTLTRAQAPVLKVQPQTNGGTQVVGWDKDTYSVTACKAVAPGSDAERLLSQISVAIENGKVSTRGPAGDGDWTVYLLVRAPRSAEIELETLNGPISVYDLDGKLTAHAHNGPISVKNFSGDADVSAQNGPISLEGSGGNVHIRTENGPISVDLKGPSWNGAGLSADAQNGPVTLTVPYGYLSGFVVETSNHTPMSCHASVCDNAR